MLSLRLAWRRRSGFLCCLILLVALLAVGCDCSEGDATSAFGPECCCEEDEAGAGQGEGSGTLLVSDAGANTIRRFEGVSGLNAPTVTPPPLQGALTRMTRPGLLAMHPVNNELIVPDEGSIAILFFDDPLSLSGDLPPRRILTGPATEMVAPIQAFVDSEADELYVLDRGGNQILIYSASATVQADVAPRRRLRGASTGILNPSAFIVQPSADRLTVITPSEVLTFNNIRAVNGDAAPAGRVGGGATTFQNLVYGEFDGSGTLVLVDRGSQSLLFFENFAFDQNNQAPTRIARGNNLGISDPGQFALTGSGGMYLANGTGVLFFDNLGELQGDPFPARRFTALNPPSQSLRGLLFP